MYKNKYSQIKGDKGRKWLSFIDKYKGWLPLEGY